MQPQLIIPFWVGLFFSLLGIGLLIFPPGFGNYIFGPKLRSPLKNEKTWKTAQTFNAFLYLVMGVTSLSFTFFDTRKYALMMVIILIALNKWGSWLIDRIIEKKTFPEQGSMKL